MKNKENYDKMAKLRFWEKVNKTDTCWEWTAHKLYNGYGRFSIYGETDYTHRISWMRQVNKSCTPATTPPVSTQTICSLAH